MQSKQTVQVTLLTLVALGILTAHLLLSYLVGFLDGPQLP